MREYKERIDIEERLMQEEEEYEMERLSSQVRYFKPRIQTLLETANEAIKCGIPLYRSSDSKEFNFISDGITHKVGLYPGHKPTVEFRDIKEFKWVGIRNGGASGSIDFVTNGETIYGSEESTHRVVWPRAKDMERFIREFDQFEQDFYSYIDKIIL